MGLAAWPRHSSIKMILVVTVLCAVGIAKVVVGGTALEVGGIVEAFAVDILGNTVVVVNFAVVGGRTSQTSP